MTSPTRMLTTAVLSLRVIYGVALIAAPARLSRRWLGPDSQRAPTQVALRGLGAREIAVHVAAGEPSGSCLRPARRSQSPVGRRC